MRDENEGRKKQAACTTVFSSFRIIVDMLTCVHLHSSTHIMGFTVPEVKW